MRELIRQIAQHMQRLVTQPVHELTAMQRRARFAIELFRHCGRALMQDRAEQMAAALAYRTIFSLIPLFVLGLVIFRTFGGFEEMQSTLYQRISYFFFPEMAYPESEVRPGEAVLLEVQDPKQEIEKAEQEAEEGAAQPLRDERMEQQAAHRQVRASLHRALTELTAKVAGLNFASIGVVGALLFIYAGMALAISVEYDFNTVFKSPRGRPWHLRVPIYWSVITLGMGLLGLSLYVSGQLVEWVGQFGVYAPVLSLLSRMLAFAASWVLLLLLYTLMPNTRVYLKPALIGSFVAAALWETSKVGFQIYVSKAVPYSALYGSLGLVPLFLLWVYLSWLIVLFGLELTYSLQVMRTRPMEQPKEEPPLRVSGDPDWLIPMLAEIGREFEGGRAIRREELCDRLRLPSRVINEFAAELQKEGLIHTVDTEDNEDPAYSLARPPEKIRLEEVLELGHALSRAEDGRGKLVGWKYLEKLESMRRAYVAEASLKTLLEDGDGGRREPKRRAADGKATAEVRP